MKLETVRGISWAPAEPVALTYPLPADRHEAKALLDAACLALWGGREWTRPRRKKAARMPQTWKDSVAACMFDRRGRAA